MGILGMVWFALVPAELYFPYSAYKEVILSIASPVQPLPETGLVTFTFDIPLEATNVNVFVKLLGPHYDEDFRHLDKAESTSGSYLQLRVFTEKPKVGEQLTVKAETTELVQSLIYQVYSKDQLVSTKTVVPKGDERSKIITFNLTVTYEMSPKLTLLVFYVRENNSEIVADAISVFVDGLFQTQVNVRFSKEKVEPGEDVDLIVEGEPNSIVYLNVKDVKVDLLKSGNDITQDRVQNEVANYNGQDSMYWNYMFSYGWSFSFYGINTDYLLKSIDVNLIIDSFVATKANLGYYGENGRGPLSSQYGDPTTPSQASISVRKRFPENWAWDILDIKSNGQGVMTLTSPDTITSWVATAFSTHPQLGLSVVKAPAKVTTFRPLFVNLDLPLSIIRNEDYCFTATVFNYYPEEVPVLLTLDQSRSFSNIHVKRDGRQVSLSKENLYYSYFLGYLVENESVSSMFCVTPLVTGDIPVRVSALTNIDRLSDAIELNLTVKAEGVPRSSSHSFLVDLSNGSWVQQVPIEFPASSVPDSQRITVNFAGNVLGSLSGDFVKLFRRQSYRTGEQNMMEFALNVYLLEFFYQTNNVKSDFMKQARDSLMKGIQYEMMYEHGSTGGFSSFGSRNGNLPSLWLTAFVLKCFSQASRLNDRYRNIVTIDKEIIARSVTWIQYQQDENGAFIEYGSPFDMAMQSELDSREELTAYTVIALWEARQLLDETIKATLDHKIEKATLLLTNQLDTITDPFTICLLAYTLHLVDSPRKQKSFDKMQEVAIIGDGLRYWKRDEPSPEYYWWYTPVDPISIQATSYALLTYSKRGIAAIEGLPIIRWLVGQLRSDGLYVSTQATALAVEALSSVGSKLYTGQDIPMTLTLSYTSGTGQARAEKFHVNKDNEMLLQSLDIDYTNDAPKSISILARTDNNQVGPSLVMAEVVLYYNVQGETQALVFNMSHVILTKRNNVYLTITIQTTSDKPAGLSILEVDIPSGYLPDLDVLSGNPALSLVEVVDDKMMCYFDTGVITIKGLNLTVPLIATGGVLTKSHPRTYRIYDFYNPDKELTKTYALEDEDFCSKVPTVGVCQYQ
ncbi:C3 and PZP-like alpha-2-macroglobulin domain-containing protein 8 [Physella acuta]|uniref:C3 and PZP-like alpha-2-macroglobulin domain-containing protein 8 n=1 Tax=Physella acuta TaxID=109671 RepID=UPI0027DD6E71|nr:C3 and PZP-like alpha-2-macroglobulin domain-containing protein 8 [Physella acuta]